MVMISIAGTKFLRASISSLHSTLGIAPQRRAVNSTGETYWFVVHNTPTKLTGALLEDYKMEMERSPNTFDSKTSTSTVSLKIV